MSVKIDVTSAPYYRRFAAGAVSAAALADMMPAGVTSYANLLYVVTEGTVTVTRLDGTDEALGTIPAGTLLPIVFVAITAGTAEVIAARSAGRVDA